MPVGHSAPWRDPHGQKLTINTTYLRRLAADAVSLDAEQPPHEIEAELTADLDAAIAAAQSSDLPHAARDLHGLPTPPPCPERWRGVPLFELRSARDGLMRAWDSALA